MPGFSLIYNQTGLDKATLDRADHLVQSNFKAQYIIKREKLLVLFTDGNNYPYRLIERNEFFILIEGKIYGMEKTDEEHFFHQLEKIYISGEFSCKDLIHDLDGEFIIYIIGRKEEKFFILNDFSGRLPLYMSCGKRFVISRDFYIMDKLTTGLLFDESSVYQYLRLGFVLGSKTLFYNIHRLKATSFISINNEKLQIQETDLAQSVIQNEFRASGNFVESLAEIFRKAVKLRLMENEKSALLLDGGPFSRLILGIAELEKLPLDALHYEKENYLSSIETEFVRQLGKLSNRTPEILTLNDWTPVFFEQMTVLKFGQISLEESNRLLFLSKFSTKYTQVLSGDGGRATLSYLFPDRKVIRLARHILKKNMLSSQKSAKLVFQVSTDRFEEELIDYLNKLPGKTNEEKFKYFQFYEKGPNREFEMEDLNRNFFWHSSPFYNPVFFKMAHSIPEKEKYHYKLYRDLIRQIDSQLGNVASNELRFSSQAKKNSAMFRSLQKSDSGFKHRENKFSAKNEKRGTLEELILNLLHRGFGGQLSIHAEPGRLELLNERTLYNLLSLLKVSEILWRRQF